MTKAELINEIKNRIGFDTDNETYAMSKDERDFYTNILKILEQESCDDCVSRQAVIVEMRNLYPDIPFVDFNNARLKWLRKYKPYLDCEEVVKSMPSVTPKREQGEWCKQNDDYNDWYECSECGYGSEGEMQYSSEHDVRTKYCPNCGAEMR